MTPLDDLIQKRLHGLASLEELKELDAQLASSPDAAEDFARATRLDFALQRHYKGEQAVSTIQSQARRLQRRRLLGIAAAALIATIIAFWFTRGGTPLAMNGDAALAAGDVVNGP